MAKVIVHNIRGTYFGELVKLQARLETLSRPSA
jgi:class 3 adenylate cyclase